jgi:protein TonB
VRSGVYRDSNRIRANHCTSEIEEKAMFEDATFDARGAVRNHAPQWMVLTAAANAALVAGLIVTPLLYSHTLPAVLQPRALYAPPPQMVKLPEQSVQQAWARPVIAMLPMIHANTLIHKTPQTDAAPSTSDLSLTGPEIGGGSSNGTPGGMDAFGGSRTQNVVKQVGPATTRVSGGVVEGLLLPHATVSYPQIARAAGVGGDVVLAATISEDGRIEHLRVISGHALLRDAAITAVKDWRYRPYLLNGKAVEVETTITVRFTLGR